MGNCGACVELAESADQLNNIRLHDGGSFLDQFGRAIMGGGDSSTNRGSESTKAQDTDEVVDAVRLALASGVGPRHRQDLLTRFGSAAAVLAASKSDLQSVSGIGPKIAARISGGAGTRSTPKRS